MFFLFLRDDVSKFYYSSNDGILFIDFFEPFTLCSYDDFFFDFFLSFLPNDEFTCRLSLLFYDRELDRFLLFIKIFCCENIFLFVLYVVLSFIIPRVNKLFCSWFFYWAFALPLWRFLWIVINCYFFFIFITCLFIYAKRYYYYFSFEIFKSFSIKDKPK